MKFETLGDTMVGVELEEMGHSVAEVEIHTNDDTLTEEESVVPFKTLADRRDNCRHTDKVDAEVLVDTLANRQAKVELDTLATH